MHISYVVVRPPYECRPRRQDVQEAGPRRGRGGQGGGRMSLIAWYN